MARILEVISEHEPVTEMTTSLVLPVEFGEVKEPWDVLVECPKCKSTMNFLDTTEGIKEDENGQCKGEVCCTNCFLGMTWIWTNDQGSEADQNLS